MVLLAVTVKAREALDEYARSCAVADQDDDGKARLDRLKNVDIGSSIEHSDLIEVSRYLIKTQRDASDKVARGWRLDELLKGASVYRPPPPPKPEPTPEYKALMRRLRLDEEQRQYDRMLNPIPGRETFTQRFPGAFDPNTSHGSTGISNHVDDTTYQDVERQMALILNVLVSIICCAVAIWIAARRWSVPSRLGLSMGGSLTVAVAEVAIYFGYIRRVSEAKTKEGKVVETKEVEETWVIEKSKGGKKAVKPAEDGMRFRKGKHR
ncbi:hypothetical protein LTR95_007570 [Oleoguttula sp. CCFEE 5521]